MSNVGVLSGRLEEFKLIELLQVMGMGLNSTTGALHLNQADGRKGLIYFASGSIVSCIELDTEALTLGAVLQQLGLATPTQLDYAFQLQTQDPLGKRIGERLVDLGTLTTDQLAHALRTQALWTVRELALWQRGTYEFHPGEQLPHGADELRIDPTHATMEVLRYEHEWEGLESYLPDGMRTHVKMVFDPPIGHPLAFHVAAWRVIAQVNRQHTVRRIATALRQPELEIARMVGPLVHEGLLVPVGAAGGPGLPEEAERLSMRHFDLFTLLIGMEQDWIRRKSAADELIGLATFINNTMRALEEACDANGLTLAPTTLQTLLEREAVSGIGDYPFHIVNNRIDIDDLAPFVRRQLDGSSRALGSGKVFYEDASATLLKSLRIAFEAINARVASPIERVQNQEAWEALFATVRERRQEG